MDFTIRPASPENSRRLQEIERLAGEAFRHIGLPDVADDEPLAAETLAEYAASGRSWIAVDLSGNPVGYVLAEVVDGSAHIAQVSVQPDCQGSGIGRALVEQVRDWAVELDLAAVTLITFAEVPWNAPLYRHLGFRDLCEDEITPELRAVRDKETSLGLDPATRVCMRMELRTGQPDRRPGCQPRIYGLG